jgi:hypothetical protein
MSDVFQTIDPPPPPPPPSKCVLPPHQRPVHTHRAVRGWGSIVWKSVRHWIGLLQYNPLRFQTIDPHPLTVRRVCTPRPWCEGRTHLLGGEGAGVNSLEDARQCSVLYLCKYYASIWQVQLLLLMF